jgi:heat-inducible transcriptional repressor
MMTERQLQILSGIVKEYIRTAQPVSSHFLNGKNILNVSPATIRNEMQQLTQEGYLLQPHTSAGRVPTDKGYRFFVDKLFEKEIKQMRLEMEKKMEDALNFTHQLTRFLADHSSSLALGYLPEENILWKEGWGEIFSEPEFREGETAAKFARMLEDFEENIDELVFDDFSQIRVYIGKENPFSKSQDFGLVMGQCSFPKNKKGLLVIAGPKRMAYDKNIALMDSVIKFLNNY